MKRAGLLSFGWLLAAGAVYVSALLLDVCWNLFDWSPRLDGATIGILAGALLATASTWFLARSSRGKVSRTVGLIACLGLIGVAAYASHIEPLSKGLMGREITSPMWYRIGRLLLMSLPIAFMALAIIRPSPHPARPPA